MTIETGVWITFFPSPSQVVGCVVVDWKRYAGKVVSTTPEGHLVIRGRTGKQLTIDPVSHHATTHATQEEATAAAETSGPKAETMMVGRFEGVVEGMAYFRASPNVFSAWRLKGT